MVGRYSKSSHHALYSLGVTVRIQGLDVLSSHDEAVRFWSAAPVQCIYTGLLAACSNNHPPFPLHVPKPLKYIIMPLARYAASLVGSRVSHDTRVPFPHTSHAPSSHGENSRRETLAPTQTERDTRQATSQSTTKASSAKPPELSFSCDGAWDSIPAAWIEAAPRLESASVSLEP